jgi:hypothetical protein
MQNKELTMPVPAGYKLLGLDNLLQVKKETVTVSHFAVVFSALIGVVFFGSMIWIIPEKREIIVLLNSSLRGNT